MAMIDAAALGAQMKRARIRAGMGVRDIAKLIRVTRHTVIAWERGIRMPRVDVYFRMLELYGAAAIRPRSPDNVVLLPDTNSQA